MPLIDLLRFDETKELSKMKIKQNDVSTEKL